MLSRYDEVMAQKANKTALIGIEIKCKEIFVKKDDLAEQNQELNEKLDGHASKLKKLDKTMEILNENLSKDIHAAVRKVAKQMDNQSQKRKQPIKNSIALPTSKRASISFDQQPMDSMTKMSQDTLFDASKSGIAEFHPTVAVPNAASSVSADPEDVQMDDWLNIIQTKANKEDLERLADIKTNKHDSDMQMRAIDIMHRMMNHMSILLLEVQKQQINETNETAVQQKSKRMFAMEQIVNVVNWIHGFDPQNVNIDNMSLPRDLRTLNDYSKVAVKDYPKQNRVVNMARESIDAGNNNHLAVAIKTFPI